jgi:hypothetical protein
VTPVEEDGDIVGRHRVRETYRAALHELQGERGEPVTLLEFFAHFFLPYAQELVLLLVNVPLALVVR